MVQDIENKLIESSRLVNEYIEKIVRDRRPAILYKAARHLIEAGGKRVRPFLVLKACCIVGGELEDAVPLAAAVEIFHNFTLIHDDIMDNDLLRRNVPTVHKVWGIPVAIVSGDLLFAKVYEAIIDWAERHKPPLERVLAIVDRFNKAAISICEGQVLDISFASLENVTEKDYFEMIGGKTAALLKASAEVGALAGGGATKEVNLLGEFAYNAGLAFQLIDDHLGATADEKTLGKPVGSDLREGKKTLIIIHALSHTSPKERQKILDALGNPSTTSETLREINKTLSSSGSFSHTIEQSRRYVEKARNSLEGLPDCDAKKDLEDLVEFVISRKH